MQISNNSTTYEATQAQRLLGALLQDQGAQGGQDLPGATEAGPPPGPPPSGGPSGARFTARTLSSLLSAQEAPKSAEDVVAKLIGETDADGDGALSMDEIQAAMGADSTASADATDRLAKAVAKLDTDGDGKLSGAELTTALDAFRAAHHHRGSKASKEPVQATQATTSA